MTASRVRRENLEVPSAQIPLLSSVGGGGGDILAQRLHVMPVRARQLAGQGSESCRISSMPKT